MRKFGLMIFQDDKEMEEIYKTYESKGIERGLDLPTKLDISGELNTILNTLSNRGYYVTGILCKENNRLEFMFLRDKKQSTNDKLTEKKIENNYEI